MEEQIAKIIQKNNIVPFEPFQESAEEITLMVMKFIEWLEFGDHKFYPNAEKNKTGYYTEGNQIIYTTKEVFDYWFNNIRK